MFYILKATQLTGPGSTTGSGGPERDGLKSNCIKQAETVRIHTLMAVRVAQALDLLTILRIPWLFETPAIHSDQVSMGHLDECVALLAKPGVKHIIGLQCPLGALSSKPTSWTHYGMELEDMPQVCNHQKRSWRNDRIGAITFAKHMPTVGRDTHRLIEQAPMVYVLRRVVPWSKEGESPYVSESLPAYPD